MLMENIMPLIKGAKPGSKGFKKNIQEMIESGHPQNQAVAAAYSASGEKKHNRPRDKRATKYKEGR